MASWKVGVTMHSCFLIDSNAGGPLSRFAHSRVIALPPLPVHLLALYSRLTQQQQSSSMPKGKAKERKRPQWVWVPPPSYVQVRSLRRGQARAARPRRAPPQAQRARRRLNCGRAAARQPLRLQPKALPSTPYCAQLDRPLCCCCCCCCPSPACSAAAAGATSSAARRRAPSPTAPTSPPRRHMDCETPGWDHGWPN